MGKSIGLVLLLATAWAQTPTFSVGTRLVQVDAIVRDGHGPVAGLTRDDFTIFDNGKPQKIAVFSVRSARNPEVKAAPLPAGAVSNRLNRRGETPASATILLIDRQNTPALDQAYANRKIIKFLEARGNRDSLGIYILSNTLRVVQDLTDDPERLDRALKNLKPQEAKGLTSDVTVDKTGDAITDQMVARSLEGLDDIVLQTKATSLKDALTEIARHLAKVPGRKNLVWVSGSFPIFVQRANYNLDFTPEMQAAGRALNNANVAIYPVDARGLMGTLSAAGSVQNAETGGGGRGCNPATGGCIVPGPGRIGEPSGLDTMNTLASLTGGRAFYNTNGIEDSIAKAVEDAELTYTLGFYPAEGSLDGTYHKLTVKLLKRGGSVHHRGGYIASKAMAGPDQGASIGELMRDPLEATGLGLLVQATADAAKQGSWTVRVTVDLHDVQLEHAGARRTGAVDLSFMAEGSGAIRTKTIRIDIPDDQFDAVLEKGFGTVESFESNAQTGALRVVVQDRTTGAAGSVRVPLRR